LNSNDVTAFQLKCRYIIAVQKDKFDNIKQDLELVKGLNVKDYKA
jgi:hypothetical protein